MLTAHVERRAGRGVRAVGVGQRRQANGVRVEGDRAATGRQHGIDDDAANTTGRANDKDGLALEEKRSVHA